MNLIALTEKLIAERGYGDEMLANLTAMIDKDIDELGKRMKSSGTYVSRAFTGTFTGDAAAFEDAAREMLRNEVEARRANETLVEHGFLVEPMADFLNTTKHSRSIGVVWCDPGKGKSKALEVYRRKDKLCVMVTATKHMSGWRALRDAILDELPTKRRLNGESWDKWIVRNFRDTLQQHRIVLKLPLGLKAEPAELVGTVEPKSRQSFKVKLTPDPAKLPAGVQMVPMDITLDGRHYGELFDFIVQGKP